MFTSKVINLNYRKLCSISSILNFQNMSRSVSTVQRLDNRGFIQVSGTDVTNFLQGLITNDVHHLEHSDCMYAMFLNPKGRVLYDSLIYKLKEPDTLLLECDKEVIDSIQKHLKIYKMKKKIDVTVNDDMTLWALFNNDLKTNDEIISSNDSMTVFKDPRVSKLGCRILVHNSVNNDFIKKFAPDAEECDELDEFRILRYKLGISEGAKDLPPGAVMPLEANCDYLHGVSFHKGCYIGQELTARTYHTGIIRRRLMPLYFESEVPELPYDTGIYSSENSIKAIGKLKGAYGHFGVGLMKISESLESPHLVVGDKKASTVRPEWWPVEAPKEKATLSKK